MNFFGQSPFYATPRSRYQSYDDDDEEDSGYYGSPYYTQQAPRRYTQQHLKELEYRRRLEAERQHQIELERQRRAELQRQYELRLRHERELEFQRQRAAQQQQQLRRKVIFLRFTHAARVIQRAVRVFLEAQRLPRIEAATIIQRGFRAHLEVRRSEAVNKIQAAFRRHLERRTTAEILSKLSVLAGLRAKLEGLRETQEAAVLARPVFDSPDAKLPNREFLVYEDALLKVMILLDGINSGGFELVRDARKLVVSRAQNLLKVIDRRKQSPPEVVMAESQAHQELHQQGHDTPAQEQEKVREDAEVDDNIDDSEESSLMEVDHPETSQDAEADEDLVSTDSNWVVLPQSTDL